MIDPKLNELTVTPLDSSRTLGPESEEAGRSISRREGLRITETIAGDANLSVGVPGVDTSGVRAGAGTAAGASALTPGTTASPAPEFVRGARGTGENVSGAGPVGRSETGLRGTGRTDASVSGDASGSEDQISHAEISARALQCWRQRGCPNGSPEVDWNTAREQLRAERRSQSRAASASV